MPNWKKVIVSGSDASLGSLLVSSSLTIGTSSLGSSENTLVIGLPPAGGTGEGGQILLQASGGLYTTASMIDNYQNKLRFLRGTNAGSDAYKLQLDMHTGQIQLPNYNSVTALTGSIVGFLAFDNAGNILTSTGSGGGGGSTFPYTGIAAIDGGLVVTGSITASGAIHAQANGAMYFRGGDDAEFWDINVVNTVGIYGQQDQGVASIKLGSGGGTISGRSGSIGIGTITPNSASLHVSGNVWATSFTGSLQGTASWANNATTASYILQSVSSSFASTASSADNFTVRGTLTAQTIVTQVITSSTDFVTGSTRFGSLITNTHQFTGSVGMTGSLTVVGPVSASSFTGSVLGTASFATSASSAISSSWASNADLLDGAHLSTLATTGSNTFIGTEIISGSIRVTGSMALTGSFGILGNISASSYTGSLLGTSSFATSASSAITSSFAISASSAISSSFATNANLLDGLDSTVFATTGSNTFRGNQTITGSVTLSGSAGVELIVRGDQVITGSLAVSGTITSSFDSQIYGHTLGRGGGGAVENTAFGFQALVRNTTATRNTAIGWFALSASNAAGASSNTAVGALAMRNNINGTLNSAFGEGALFSNTSGQSNTSVGYNSLASNIDGGGNVAVGWYAGDTLGDGATANTTADNSIYIGYSAYASQSNGQNEIVIGASNVGHGSNTVTLGNASITRTILRGAVSASGGITGSLFGTASFATSASWAPSVGGSTFPYTGSAVITGSLIVTGSLNVLNTVVAPIISASVINFSSLSTNIKLTIDESTIEFGENVLPNFIGSVYETTAIGYNALSGSTTGFWNTAIGSQTLRSSLTGYANVAVGRSTLSSSRTGNNNTAIGAGALGTLITGSNNTAIGSYSGAGFSAGDLTFSSRSVFIGYNAAASQSNSTNEIVIGTDAIGHGSNTVTIGNLEITRTILRGAVSASGGLTGSLLGTASFAVSASWAPGGGGGTPGGANNTVQFNDGGTFSGSGDFVFDKINDLLIITGSIIASGSSGGSVTNTITYVGNVTSSTTTLDLTQLSGLTIGDIVFVGSSNDNTGVISLPTGYTSSFDGSAGSAPSYRLSYKFITSSADITSITVSSGAASHIAAAFRNVQGLNVSASTTNTTGLPDPPSITTTVNGAMIIAWGFEDDITGSISGPSAITASAGYNLISAVSYGASIGNSATTMAEYLLQSVSGTINPGVFTSGQAFTDNWAGITLALTPTTSSLATKGTITANSFTGSLYGTASWAVSASWAPGGGSQWITNGSNIYYNTGRVGIGVTSPTVALDIANGSIKAGSNTATEGTVILQDYYTAGNLTNFGTNRSSGGPVISYASVPSTASADNFTSTYSSALGRGAIIIQDRISFYTTASQTVASGSPVGIAERVRIADTGQLTFYRYTATSSFPGTVAAVLAVDSSGNVITTAASGSAGGGGGTPGGANTTIQFNDSNAFSGSGNFTFTKATNTVKIQGSGSILLHITGSQGDLLRIQDSGSSPGTLAVISSGSLNVATFTTSSVIISGSLQVSGSTHGIAEHMILAISDETTNITTGTAKVTFRAPFAMTLTQIPRASLSTASSSGLVTVDINEGGTSILGANKLSIDATEKTSTTAATPTTLADTAIADDAEITIDIDTAGTGAKGLKVTLYYIKT